MEITKDKIKRATIVAGISAIGLEYMAVSVAENVQLFIDYKFQASWDGFVNNLKNPLQVFPSVLSNEYWVKAQYLVAAGALYVAGKPFFEKTAKYEDASDYGAYGTARWAKDHEIFGSEDITTDMKREGTVLGIHKKKTIILDAESYLNRNILIIGGSGAGKTRSLIISNILKNTHTSIVCTDPKGELYEKTSAIKRAQGYDVHLVNFKNRDISDRYNLFDYIRRDSDTFKVADSMVSNAGEGAKIQKDFWNQKQIAVLQAVMLYVKHQLPDEQKHMGSVQTISGLSEKKIKALFETAPKGTIVHNAYLNAIDQLKDKTFSDVFATMQNTLNPWLYDDVCKFTSANDFLFEDLGKKKMIVYVILPVADNEFKPLITTFFTQMFSELYRLADLNYGELPQKVLLMLDEFANIGKITSFEERVSTTRSLGIEVMPVLQDLAQLDKVYGKDSAKEIVSNCDTRILLKTTELNTAKYFSNYIGKTTIKVTNTSSSKGKGQSSKSESVQYMGRDLITPDEVTRMKRHDQIVMIAGQYPMKIKKSWFDEIKQFKDLLGNKVSRDDYPVPDRGEYEAFEYSSINLKKEAFIKEVMFIPNDEAGAEQEDTDAAAILEQLAEPEEKEDELESTFGKYGF